MSRVGGVGYLIGIEQGSLSCLPVTASCIPGLGTELRVLWAWEGRVKTTLPLPPPTPPSQSLHAQKYSLCLALTPVGRIRYLRGPHCLRVGYLPPWGTHSPQGSRGLEETGHKVTGGGCGLGIRGTGRAEEHGGHSPGGGWNCT